MRASTLTPIAVILFAHVGCGSSIDAKDPGVVYVNNTSANNTVATSNNASNAATNNVSMNNASTNNVSMNNASTNNVSMNNASTNNTTPGNNSTNNASTNNAPTNNTNTNNASNNTTGGACFNETDIAVLTNADNREPIDSCGLICSIESDVASCASGCIQMETGMTAPCADCLGEAVECTVNNCLMECAAGSTDPVCVECQELYCQDDFEVCSGIPLP